MFLRLLPLITCLAPIIGANLAFVIGVYLETLPPCIPYIDGCVSISATGRTPPGSFLFRAVHMPFATLLAVTWYFSYAWLRVLEPTDYRKLIATVLISGLLAALALIIYTTYLGTKEPLYEFMRRFGIYLYFAGTAVSQLCLSLVLRGHAQRVGDTVLARYARWMLSLLALPFALGILNLILKAILEDANATENRIEWVVALLMQIWFFVLYRAWQRTAFDVRVVVRSNVDS